MCAAFFLVQIAFAQVKPGKGQDCACDPYQKLAERQFAEINNDADDRERVGVRSRKLFNSGRNKSKAVWRIKHKTGRVDRCSFGFR